MDQDNTYTFLSRSIPLGGKIYLPPLKAAIEEARKKENWLRPTEDGTGVLGKGATYEWYANGGRATDNDGAIFTFFRTKWKLIYSVEVYTDSDGVWHNLALGYSRAPYETVEPAPIYALLEMALLIELDIHKPGVCFGFDPTNVINGMSQIVVPI